jgi:hypothetical protein
VQHRVDSCSFSTILNALRQCPVFADNHSFRSLQGFKKETLRLLK